MIETTHVMCPPPQVCLHKPILYMLRSKVSGMRWVESKVQIPLGRSKEVKMGQRLMWAADKVLITKAGGCTSGGKREVRGYVDILLDKTDSPNEKMAPFSRLFLFLRYNKRGSLSWVQVCLSELWTLSWSLNLITMFWLSYISFPSYPS